MDWEPIATIESCLFAVLNGWILLIKNRKGDQSQGLLKILFPSTRSSYYIPYKPHVSGTFAVTDRDTKCQALEIQPIDPDAAPLMENKVDWLLIGSEGYENKVLKGAR